MVDVSDSGAEAQQSLRLLVKGFPGFDARLLDGVIKLSKRRNPALELADEAQLSSVDVIMIDGKDAQAVEWSQKHQNWLAKQAVVWVDSQHALPEGHTGLQRPVQWTNLPVILSRVMDDVAHRADAESRVSDIQINVSQAAHFTPATPAPQMAQQPTPAIVMPSSAPSVLVVDDSAAVRGHLDSALKAVGYNVTCVDSGEAAIIAAGARAYACVLMDVLMPGIDGYEACRKIKSLVLPGGNKRPAIIMLTSKSSPFDRIRGKMAGCDAYLGKPVQKSHLMQVLAQFAFKTAGQG